MARRSGEVRLHRHHRRDVRGERLGGLLMLKALDELVDAGDLFVDLVLLIHDVGEHS